MKCRKCGAAVPEDSERCPKCLRKSGVPGPEAEKPHKARENASPRQRALQGSIAFGVVVGLILGFRVVERQRARPVPAPSIFGLDAGDGIVVRSSRTLEENQLYTLNLAADGGDFEPTFERLRLDAMRRAVTDAKKDQSASGKIRVFLPPRFRMPNHEQRVKQQATETADVLARAHVSTPKGDPVLVTFEFGELPDGR